MKQYQKYLAVISAILLTGECEMAGWQGLAVQLVWSTVWMTVFLRSVKCLLEK